MPGSTFMALEHVTQGALLCPIFGAPHKIFYVVDCVDADMFLRINDIDGIYSSTPINFDDFRIYYVVQ
jgi:hypothetical protein